MYGLPPSTSLSRPLPKAAVYEKFGFKNAEREAFDRDISRMAIVEWVSPKTVPAIAAGTEVQDFYVVHIALKRREYDPKQIILLTKLIPQRMLFALEEGDATQFAVFHTRLLKTEWCPTAEATIKLNGLDFDKVWHNIVAFVGGLDASSAASLEEQVLQREERQMLLRQIEQLERQCRAEKQTRRKYELYQKLLTLKQLL